MKNIKGQNLREWNIESEDKVRFILKDPRNGEITHYPKSSFEHDKENSGAYQDGSKIIKPDIK